MLHFFFHRRGLKSVAALLPLLGVTWLLGFVVQWSEVLLYLFIILNSTQVKTNSKYVNRPFC